MELYEIKKQLKKEKTNYYDKNLFKRIFRILVGHPDMKLYILQKKLIAIQKNILLNYMENLEKICYYVMLL